MTGVADPPERLGDVAHVVLAAQQRRVVEGEEGPGGPVADGKVVPARVEPLQMTGRRVETAPGRRDVERAVVQRPVDLPHGWPEFGGERAGHGPRWDARELLLGQGDGVPKYVRPVVPSEVSWGRSPRAASSPSSRAAFARRVAFCASSCASWAGSSADWNSDRQRLLPISSPVSTSSGTPGSGGLSARQRPSARSCSMRRARYASSVTAAPPSPLLSTLVWCMLNVPTSPVVPAALPR
nr:hypothetical protein [Streptomyces sp. Ru87]